MKTGFLGAAEGELASRETGAAEAAEDAASAAGCSETAAATEATSVSAAFAAAFAAAPLLEPATGTLSKSAEAATESRAWSQKPTCATDPLKKRSTAPSERPQR